MSASVGHRIRMHSNSVDTPDRTGTIVAVLGGSDGADGPPYRVRFDSGEETIVTPGPDAVIEPPSLTERLDQAGEKAAEVRDRATEKAEEVADTVRERGGEVAGEAARVVSEVADKVAKRFER